MFTGIIEQIGSVTTIIRKGQLARLSVSAPKYFDEIKVGESIAVNGVCLTVNNNRHNAAEFDLSDETVRNSNLGTLKIGEKVNLERALLLHGRLGGHIVTGHIDGVGEIKYKKSAGEGFELYLSIPSEILRYLVVKGSIAVDGVSLTVADFHEGLLKIAVIPQTAKSTILSLKSQGDRVNLEVDLLSKYVEKHLRGEPKTISDETMMRVGFLPIGWTDN